MSANNIIRVPFEKVREKLQNILMKHGFSETKAALSARLFAETTRDGVYSHGLNRFPRFLETVKKGYVRPANEPKLVEAYPGHEVWDGQLGPGNLNAYQAMGRALSVAKDRGIGIVAMRNTNHWMRGGTYGWQAVESGSAAICFTNTEPNMPPWGGQVSKIGNNPLIMAVPHAPNHIVLDMAMSQFSFGKMEDYRLRGDLLPFNGGFTRAGVLTDDPGEIIESKRALPAGYWKGSGLSVMLDLLTTILSGGNSTAEIGKKGYEYAVSQFFMAIDMEAVGRRGYAAAMAEQMKQEIHQSLKDTHSGNVFYPGERTILTREENMIHGLPVNTEVWNVILSLS